MNKKESSKTQKSEKRKLHLQNIQSFKKLKKKCIKDKKNPKNDEVAKKVDRIEYYTDQKLLTIESLPDKLFELDEIVSKLEGISPKSLKELPNSAFKDEEVYEWEIEITTIEKKHNIKPPI